MSLGEFFGARKCATMLDDSDECLGCAGCGGPGFVEGCFIETTRGLQEVSSLRPGDRVLSFEHGFVPVVDVTTYSAWSLDETCPDWILPIFIPAGALGNSTDTIVVHDQLVAYDDDEVEALTGLDFVIVPAAALCGRRGIQTLPSMMRRRVFHLEFDEDEIIPVNDGTLLCSLTEKLVPGKFLRDRIGGAYWRQGRILGADAAADLVDRIDAMRTPAAEPLRRA